MQLVNNEGVSMPLTMPLMLTQMGMIAC